MRYALALALALFVVVDEPKCDPACAKGETCAREETCYETGCSERFVCEGTPDDCRTNGCPDDHQVCACQGGNEFACEEKPCEPRPMYIDCWNCWRCAEWSTTKDACCLDWRYGEETE